METLADYSTMLITAEDEWKLYVGKFFS